MNGTADHGSQSAARENRNAPVAAAEAQADDGLYGALRDILKAAGCFEPTPWIVALKIVVLLSANAAAWLLLLSAPDWPIRVLALAVLACAHAQCGFLAHDAFHGTLSGRRRLDEFLGQLLLSFTTGLSYSYFFKRNHRLHHAQCGRETEDPEMQSDILALYGDAARTKSGFSRWTTRHQAWLFWLLLSVNTFSLRLSGLAFVRQYPDSTRSDQAAILLHAAAWLVLPALVLGVADAAVNYVALTWFSGIYLTGIFPFYHVGCRTLRADETASFLRQQIEGTRNMSSSWLAELYAGGTNNHIEHHLFPGIPTARLRRARSLTRAFCRARGIAYNETGYRAALGVMTRHLSALARQAAAGGSA